MNKKIESCSRKLILYKKKENETGKTKKVKREIMDRDRERRTTKVNSEE